MPCQARPTFAHETGRRTVKLLTCLLFATMLAGCLPIGIRATSLPNYAGTQSTDAGVLPAA